MMARSLTVWVLGTLTVYHDGVVNAKDKSQTKVTSVKHQLSHDAGNSHQQESHLNLGFTQGFHTIYEMWCSQWQIIVIQVVLIWCGINIRQEIHRSLRKPWQVQRYCIWQSCSNTNHFCSLLNTYWYQDLFWAPQTLNSPELAGEIRENRDNNKTSFLQNSLLHLLTSHCLLLLSLI